MNVLCKDGHRMHCDGEVLERLIYVILKLKRVSHQQTTPEIFLSGNERWENAGQPNQQDAVNTASEKRDKEFVISQIDVSAYSTSGKCHY